MSFSYRIVYGSHLPVLIKLVGMTGGPVLEMGTGIYSTPVLHWMCVPERRMVYSYDIEEEYFSIVSGYACDFHKMVLLDNWDRADIERPWDVVLIDHSPAARRIVDIMRVANWAKYIVVHDTDSKQEKHYNYKSIYPNFKYQYNYTVVNPQTTILSNLVDLGRICFAS